MSNAKIPSIRRRMRQQEILAMKLAGPVQGRRCQASVARNAATLIPTDLLDRAGKKILQLAWGLTHHGFPRATH